MLLNALGQFARIIRQRLTSRAKGLHRNMASSSSSSPSPSSFSSSSSPSSFSSLLRFDNRNLREMPVDKEVKIYSRQVPNAIFSLSPCTPVLRPRVVAVSEDALSLLGVDVKSLQEAELERYLSGNEVLPGSQMYSHNYCGHQFGFFSGQLGDGAAISLGECVNSNEERWELQLKGSGPTPYSRSSDGRKVLRSSIREFLCSEAMFYLGVPTTRAATCITSDTTIPRDPFYDGNVLDENCTVVSRLAPNFFRFGSFEIFKPKDGDGENARVGPSYANTALKKKLLDHVLLFFPNNSFSEGAPAPVAAPAPAAATAVTTTNPRIPIELSSYRSFFRQVVKSTAILVAKWQAFGFVHGVLNTDNMSIMGITIDYGPFAFLEHFDPDFTPNGSDGGARYTYSKQPAICRWNLVKFSEVLHPFLPLSDSKSIIDEDYDLIFQQTYMGLMRAKLGLLTNKGKRDEILVEKLFETMTATHADFTDTFQALGVYMRGDCSDKSLLLRLIVSRCATPQQLVGILQRKRRVHRLGMHPQQIEALWKLLQQSPDEVAQIFDGAPIDALREEIGGEKRKLDMLIKVSERIKKAEQTTVEEMESVAKDHWSNWIDMYKARLDEEEGEVGPSSYTSRAELMGKHNPTFVLRNWIAQEAIEAAEKEDFSQVRAVLNMLKDPFNSQFSTFHQEMSEGIRTTTDIQRYVKRPPDWACSLLCTCSS